jgi:hypothetical protein
MRRRGDDDSLPVMVPRNEKALVAIAPERVRRLREHLIEVLGEFRTAKRWELVASPERPRVDDRNRRTAQRDRRERRYDNSRSRSRPSGGYCRSL